MLLRPWEYMHKHPHGLSPEVWLASDSAVGKRLPVGTRNPTDNATFHAFLREVEMACNFWDSPLNARDTAGE